MNIRFGSVCSGIEAASVAFGPLGWKASWLSEVDPHASATLKYYYPDTPNHGDMTKLPDRILSGEIEAPELLCGGTPCQAFSVAGLKKSLKDSRGNLTLKFVEVANAIDTIRNGRNLKPCIIFWENVPGVLNTEDNAFGCFLAGIAGESVPLRPPGGRWTNAGYVLGPQRAIAWRMLDAQYFGLAQRRERVFVVASARDGFNPEAVLFEFDGLRRDTPPSRETGKGTTAGVEIGPGGGRFTELAPTLDAGCKDGFIRNQVGCGVAHSLRAEGYDASEDGTGRGTPIVPVAIHPHCIGRGPDSGPQGKEYLDDGSAYTMDSRGVAQAVCFAQNTRDEVRMVGGDGGIAGALASEPGAKQQNYIAFSCKDHGADAGEISPTLRSMGHDTSHANAGGQVAVALSVRTANTSSNGWGIQEEVAHTLDRTSGPAVATGVFFAGQGAKAGSIAYDEQLSPTLKSTDSGTNRTPTAHIGMQVRRLTPRECEKLQGFPTDYTLIPYRRKKAKETGENAQKLLTYYHLTDTGKKLVEMNNGRILATADGPRYKCLGNSWAVPVVRWIGRRIEKELQKRGGSG